MDLTYNIPKDIFYLLQGDPKSCFLGFQIVKPGADLRLREAHGADESAPQHSVCDTQQQKNRNTVLRGLGFRVCSLVP